MPLLNEKAEADSSDFALRWYKVRNRVKEEFGQRPDLNAILFIIGMNEVGIVKEKWEKEEKANKQNRSRIRVFFIAERYQDQN